MIFEPLLSTHNINRHYINRYIKFISYFLSKEYTHETYTEKHHILPKSIYKEYKNFTLYPHNCVKLPHRAHFIAHKILSKCFRDITPAAKMHKAFWRMVSCSKLGERIITSKMYEDACKSNSVAMKINNPMHSDNTKEKMKASWKKFMLSEKGQQHSKFCSDRQTGVCNISEDGFKRLSDRWLGVKRPKTQEHIINHRKSLSNGIFVTPWGNFYSPQNAADHENNLAHLSRHLINKFCKEQINDFNFIPKI